jgi:hypothetical protein
MRDEPRFGGSLSHVVGSESTFERSRATPVPFESRSERSEPVPRAKPGGHVASDLRLVRDPERANGDAPPASGLRVDQHVTSCAPGSSFREREQDERPFSSTSSRMRPGPRQSTRTKEAPRLARRAHAAACREPSRREHRRHGPLRDLRAERPGSGARFSFLRRHGVLAEQRARCTIGSSGPKRPPLPGCRKNEKRVPDPGRGPTAGRGRGRRCPTAR